MESNTSFKRGVSNTIAAANEKVVSIELSDDFKSEMEVLSQRVKKLSKFSKVSIYGLVVGIILTITCFSIETLFSPPTLINDVHLPSTVINLFPDESTYVENDLSGGIANLDSMSVPLLSAFKGIFPVLGIIVIISFIFRFHSAHRNGENPFSSFPMLVAGLVFIGMPSCMSVVTGSVDENSFSESPRAKFHSLIKSGSISEIEKVLKDKNLSSDSIAYVISQLILKRNTQEGQVNLSPNDTARLKLNVDVLTNSPSLTFIPDTSIIYLLENEAHSNLSPFSIEYLSGLNFFARIFNSVGTLAFCVTLFLLVFIVGSHTLCLQINRRLSWAKQFLPSQDDSLNYKNPWIH
jgi:hypothetical protein